MAFSWRLDPDAPLKIVRGNLLRITIEELEDGQTQDPKVTYFGDVNKDKGSDMPEFKVAVMQVIKDSKPEIKAARIRRARLAAIASNISDVDLANFETFILS